MSALSTALSKQKFNSAKVVLVWRRLCKLRRYPDLRAEVISQLEALWSPGQIAGRLMSERLSPVRVCAETIYRFIYGKEDHERGLYQYLSEARRKRRPLRSRKPRNGAFPASHRISQRPDFVGNRSRFGHWEGDLIIFERPFGQANVTSLIERKSRYTVLIKNRSRHSQPIMDGIVRAFSFLPTFARQSFTFDRGTEFAAFLVLKMVLERAAGSTTPACLGKQVPSKTPTSVSAASCRRI
jgi:IS30 family transposase